MRRSHTKIFRHIFIAVLHQRVLALIFHQAEPRSRNRNINRNVEPLKVHILCSSYQLIVQSRKPGTPPHLRRIKFKLHSFPVSRRSLAINANTHKERIARTRLQCVVLRTHRRIMTNPEFLNRTESIRTAVPDMNNSVNSSRFNPQIYNQFI